MEAIAPAVLRRYSLFGGLLDADLALLMPRLRPHRYQPGEPLIAEGDHGSSILLLVSGRVEVLKRREDGHASHLTELGPGDAIGEMELIDLQPRSSTVVAIEPVEALSLDRADLLALKRENVAAFAVIALNLARDLSRRLRLMNIEMARRDAVRERQAAQQQQQ